MSICGLAIFVGVVGGFAGVVAVGIGLGCRVEALRGLGKPEGDSLGYSGALWLGSKG